MAEPILAFERVSTRLGGDTIFDELSFAVAEGEFLCILGPSGCGKSTSLRLIGDLLQVQGGRVIVDGKSPAEAWRSLAYVFQSPRLVPWRTALGNVLLGMELRYESGDKAMGKAAMQARAKSLLELVGLGRDAHKYPSMLSGGERQRVAIARALAVEPRIILMDEPFSALDPNTRRRLRAEIVSIWQQTGKTVIFVTHDIDEALVLADRILLLSNKPTKVMEILNIDALRPRDVDADPALLRQRQHLHALFTGLEPDPVSV
ncbi:MAG: ABC transporter ATP-binding protein [Rhodospirillaceae bacterium]|nr:ABC transporter ATP-binding protein [Rhodospirillaceae bacterium]